MKHRCATILLLLALTQPASARAEDYGEMFGLMFRMMLTAMNVMADMVSNDNDWGWGGGSWANPWGGSPWSGSSMLWPGMGLAGWPGSSPWSAPWGTIPGMSPWSGGGGLPWGNGFSPLSAAGSAATPFNGATFPSPAAPGLASPVRAVPPGGALLDGKWYGNTGEILEIHGNRFRLRNAQLTIKGVASVEQNLLKLYTPQTNALSVYSFVRNQTELILQEPSGNVLVFQRHPVAGFGNPVLF